MRNEWWTPAELRARVLAEHRIVLDAAACAQSKLVDEYLGPDHQLPGRRDALAFDHWHDLVDHALGDCEGAPAVVWLNAPYLPSKTLYEFLGRAVATAAAGTTVLALVPSATGTRWWWDHVLDGGGSVEFLRGRLAFTGPHAGSGSATVAPWACALVTWRPPPQPGGQRRSAAPTPTCSG
ncbi:phage N-6-adenine-methyltransferase [Nocardioidaceae bacterium]|nr:phage N-6-adenine-methyltransferase [Nocardioidaceae bacterium]